MFLNAPRGEKRVLCPFCNALYKCYINEKLGVFYCFHCGEKGNLTKEVTDNSTRLVLIRIEEQVAPLYNWKDYFVPLSSCFSVLQEYVIGRVGVEITWKYPFGEIQVLPYKNRLTIPIDNFSYFQSRILGKGFPKYLNPTSNLVKQKRNESIWGIEYLDPSSIPVICEGVFSALAIPLPYQGIAILGKFLSSIQLERIRNLVQKKVIVCLDAGTEKETLQIVQQLLPYKEVSIIGLERGDPDSNKGDIRRLLDGAKRVELTHLIWLLADTNKLVL